MRTVVVSGKGSPNAEYGELAVSKAPDLARMGKHGTGNYIGPYSPPNQKAHPWAFVI